MNGQAAASVIAAAVASSPGWAMFAIQRAANQRHGERIAALHEKVDRLGGAGPSTADGDGGEGP